MAVAMIMIMAVVVIMIVGVPVIVVMFVSVIMCHEGYSEFAASIALVGQPAASQT